MPTEPLASLRLRNEGPGDDILLERLQIRPTKGSLVRIVLVAGEAVGAVDVGPAVNGCAEAVYSILKSHKGRGYATEALRRVAPWAARHLRLERVEVRVSLTNRASQRVAEKAGFRCEGAVSSRVTATGIEYEDLLYAWSAEPRRASDRERLG